MIVKKAEYKKVMKEVNERISDDVYGCDQCKKEFGGADKLQIDVFFKDENLKKQSEGNLVDKYDFCSWVCVFKFLPKIKTDSFVNLPYLMYDSKTKGATVKDFLKLIKGKV
jgi:hypothetical protein